MSKSVALIASLLFCLTAIAQFKGAYTKGDKLNVLTLSGINLRAGAASTSATLVKIPYGAAVVVTDDSLRKIGHRVEEIERFIIEGYWVKVRFGDKEGYVFDGYLSKLPAPDYKDSAVYEEGWDLHYLKTSFRNTAVRKNTKKYNGCKPTKADNCICAFEERFENDITYSEDICSEAGSINVLKIKGATLAEMFLLAKVIAQQWYGSFEIKYDTKKRMFDFNNISDGAGCGGTVQTKNGFAVFTWGCGC